MLHRLILLLLVLATAAATATTVQPIHEELDIQQGYHTKLDKPIPFGYIHYMDATFRRFWPDQPVHQEDEEKNDQEFPDFVMTVLSNVTYTAADAPLYFEGRVSASTYMELNHHSLRKAAINLQFSTYALDETTQTWFRRFYSGDRLRGRVSEALVDRCGDHFKLMLRVDPLPGLLQRLWVARNSVEQPRGMFWGPRRSDMDKFQQIVMNDVVF